MTLALALIAIGGLFGSGGLVLAGACIGCATCLMATVRLLLSALAVQDHAAMIQQWFRP